MEMSRRAWGLAAMLRVLIAFILVSIAGVAQAERRVALVMGAADYRTIRKLDNAVGDAQAIETTLKQLGFEVTLRTDADLLGARRALDDFRKLGSGADVALVFFAGHGVEIAGDNRLLPVDADASSLDALKASTLPLEEVRETVAAISRIGLIMLDACRSDPFGSASASGRSAVALAQAKEVRPGLGRVGKAEGVLFAFAAAPGETASDGVDGHSPFTGALVKYLGTDGLELRSTLTLVQQEVYDTTHGEQLPYVESGLPKLFFASATSEQLPERERLLLAMADVTPEMRAEVERVASDADMPLAPLYGALISTEGVAMTQAERDRKLQEAADAFVQVRAELRSLRSSDPEVTRLRQEAEQQLALGAFDTARAKLVAAADIDSRSRQALQENLVERTLSEASTRYLSAGAARASLRYDLAIADLEKVIALYGEAGDGLDPHHADKRLSALLELGDLYTTTGNIAAAARAYEAMRFHAEKRIEDDPSDPSIERDLAVAHSKVGDTRIAQGDLPSALDAYRAALAILETVTDNPLPNPDWLAQLAVAHDAIGGILFTQGDLEAALASFEASLKIKRALSDDSPDDTKRLRDLTVVYDELGNVLLVLGNIERALQAYDASLQIRLELGRGDPSDNAGQRDISISYDKLGDVFREQGKLDAALASYDDGSAIIQRLAQHDPGDTQLKRDLAVSATKIGNVLREGGDLPAALQAYRDSLSVVSELAASDPQNSEWQRDLSIGLEKVADVLEKQGDLKGALDGYEQSLPIMRRLAANDATNAQWQRDLSITLAEIGYLRFQIKDVPKAADAFVESLEIRQRLAAAAPDNAVWQRDLVIAYIDFARVAKKPREPLTRALDIMLELQSSGRLPEKDAPMVGALQRMLAKLAAQGK